MSENDSPQSEPYVFECMACGRVTTITLGLIECPACGSSTGVYYPKKDGNGEQSRPTPGKRPDRKEQNGD